LESRQRRANSSDVAELTLMSPGDIFFLYTDGVYDGSDKEERQQLETSCASTTCCRQETYAGRCSNTLSNETIVLRQIGEEDRIDDKTVLSSSGIDEYCDECMVVSQGNSARPSQRTFASPAPVLMMITPKSHELSSSAPETCAFS